MMTQRSESEGPTANAAPTAEQVRAFADRLAEQGQGPISIADALVSIAAEMMQAKVGRAGAALWLRDVFDDVRLGRVPHH